MVGFGEVLERVIHYWYVWVILALGIYAVNKFFKDKMKKREYHSEINRHHEIIEKQMALSPTDYKKLFHRGKQIGQIYSLAQETRIKEIPVKDDKGKTISEYQEIEEFVNMGVKMKKSLIPGIWTNKVHMKLMPENIQKNFATKTIYLDSAVDPILFMDYATTTERKLQFNILDNFYKTMFDHTVDGMGNQAHNLAEIRDMWAFQLAMKDKEIERIAEEKKLLPTRSR